MHTVGTTIHERAGGKERQRKAPAPTNPELDASRLLPEAGVAEPKAENRARAEQGTGQLKDSASLTPATPAERYYLQAGLFSDQVQAEKLQARLTGLGFRSDIQALHTGSEPVRYSVRVGPYGVLLELENPEQKLKAMDFDVQILTVQE